MFGKRHGFTLIELLVVIAIIAILAAILFPVFARARAKAQQNNCLSNVKQLQLSEIMYATDNNDRFPCWSDGVAQCWQSMISPYIKNTQIYLCPSDGTWGAWLQGYTGTTITQSSYGANYYSVGAGNGTTPMVQSNVLYPAQMYSICDSTNWTAFNGVSTTYFNPLHNSGMNFSFVDGHAKWLSNAAVNGDPNYALSYIGTTSRPFWYWGT